MLTCHWNAITEMILLKHLVWNVIIPLMLHSLTPSTPDEKPLTDMKLNHKYTVLMRIGKRSFIVFAVY